MIAPLPGGLLTAKEAADFLKLSVRHFRRLSIRRVKMGRAVRYQQSDLELYIALHVEGPTKRKNAA